MDDGSIYDGSIYDGSIYDGSILHLSHPRYHYHPSGNPPTQIGDIGSPRHPDTNRLVRPQ